MLTKLKMIKKQRHAHPYGEHLLAACGRAEEKQCRIYEGWRIDLAYEQIKEAVRDQVFNQIEDSLFDGFGITEDSF